jgi:amino acid transporter
MANLAQIAGLYTFLLFGAKGAAASIFWVTFVGVIWIAMMTAIVTIGIELSARSQWFLLAAEYVILVVFAIVALVKVYTQHPAGSIHPAWSWFAPWDVSSFNALTAGVLLAVFIYWGWTAASPSTRRRRTARGLPASRRSSARCSSSSSACCWRRRPRPSPA